MKEWVTGNPILLKSGCNLYLSGGVGKVVLGEGLPAGALDLDNLVVEPRRPVLPDDLPRPLDRGAPQVPLAEAEVAAPVLSPREQPVVLRRHGEGRRSRGREADVCTPLRERHLLEFPVALAPSLCPIPLSAAAREGSPPTHT